MTLSDAIVYEREQSVRIFLSAELTEASKIMPVKRCSASASIFHGR